MIKLIGTTHLIKKEEIERIIKEENPEVIGVELCLTRLNLMVLNPPEKKEEKEGTTLIDKISKVIKKKAEEENLQYGSDMINASKYALENNIPLILVDKDIIEIKGLMELIPQNELMFFMSELSKLETEKLEREINEEEVLKNLKLKTPIAFEFLITLRDLHISNQILKTIRDFPEKKILIFLGKGHIKGIEKLLSDIKPIQHSDERRQK